MFKKAIKRLRVMKRLEKEAFRCGVSLEDYVDNMVEFTKTQETLRYDELFNSLVFEHVPDVVADLAEDQI